MFLCLSIATSGYDALGCSPVMGYIRPTNFELVKEADTIVLARADSFERKGEVRRSGAYAYGIFKFRIQEKLKGDFNDTSLAVEGDTNIRSWGDPNDFSYAKPDHGPCNPTDYKIGSTYVLFLSRWKSQWSVSGPAFTRVNVEIEGTNAPWAKAVRHYVRIANVGDYEKEKVLLHNLRARALANDPDCPTALAKDIETHFKKPTPAKSFVDLKSLYEQTNDSETRELVLWAFARGEKAEAKDFLHQLIGGGEWKQYLYPVCSYISAVKLIGFHEPIAAALADNKNEHERRMLLFALSGTADIQQQVFMQRVLESVNNQEAAVLSKWFVNHPSPEAIKYYTSLASKDYAEETDLTFALAAMGDTNVVNWAKEFVKKTGERDWVGYYVFARSPLPIADALAQNVIRSSNSEALTSLVQGYSYSTRPDRLERLKEIVAVNAKSKNLVYWLRRTIGEMASHGDKQAEALLSQIPVVEPER